MSRPPFGVVKGRRGRLVATSQLPAQQEGVPSIPAHNETAAFNAHIHLVCYAPRDSVGCRQRSASRSLG
jgi:hypothetical protein